MKRNLKRFLCLCLAAVMMLGMFPATAFADGGGGGTNGSTEGWAGSGGAQTIWVANGAKQFVRVTLVKLPKGSATPLGEAEVVNSIVLHNGLPTDEQNVVMVGNNALDFAKSKAGLANNWKTTSTTAKALRDCSACACIPP